MARLHCEQDAVSELDARPPVVRRSLQADCGDAAAPCRPRELVLLVTDLEVATALSKHFEGFYSKPYLCSAGVPTVGFGATYYEDGTLVTLRDPPITRERAIALLAFHLTKVYLPAVRRLCPGIDVAARRGAIADFALNVGAGNLKTSTLRKKINAGEWDKVPEQLRRWTRGGGRVLRGLVLRREAEIGYI